jgi:hypothetical protein
MSRVSQHSCACSAGVVHAAQKAAAAQGTTVFPLPLSTLEGAGSELEGPSGHFPPATMATTSISGRQVCLVGLLHVQGLPTWRA